MDRLIWIVVFIIILFVLTYDPRSQTLNKYITPETQSGLGAKEEVRKLSGGANDFRTNYESVQFGQDYHKLPQVNSSPFVNGVIV